MRCYDSFTGCARALRGASMIDRHHRPDDLRMRYIASFPQKRVALAAAWYSFLVDPRVDMHRLSLHAQVHRLAGSASAYGFAQLGEQAHIADRLLRAAEDPSQNTRALLDLLAERLRDPINGLLLALERGGSATPRESPVTGPPFSVFLVEDDLAQAVPLVDRGEQRAQTRLALGEGLPQAAREVSHRPKPPRAHRG
jgi:HPt (histidine-containing phosphotransfer) domain-containing protein